MSRRDSRPLYGGGQAPTVSLLPCERISVDCRWVIPGDLAGAGNGLLVPFRTTRRAMISRRPESADGSSGPACCAALRRRLRYCVGRPRYRQHQKIQMHPHIPSARHSGRGTARSLSRNVQQAGSAQRLGQVWRATGAAEQRSGRSGLRLDHLVRPTQLTRSSCGFDALGCTGLAYSSRWSRQIESVSR
jgi:hypothetical protein